MEQRQVPCLAADRRLLPSLAFGVLVHVPSHFDLHALSFRVRFDPARVAWYFGRSKLFSSARSIGLSEDAPHHPLGHGGVFYLENSQRAAYDHLEEYPELAQ